MGNINQGSSNCGTPATTQWYTGLLRKKSKDKKYKNVPPINAVIQKT
jgi:hypothetical protein